MIRTFFDSGSPRPNEKGTELLSMLAGELGKLANKVSSEGHTDSKPYAGIRDYGNWELSTDRANAARRLMQQKGVGLDQVSGVRGFADQKLRIADNPLDSSNRRITLIVQYIVKDLDEDSDSVSRSSMRNPSDVTVISIWFLNFSKSLIWRIDFYPPSASACCLWSKKSPLPNL